jgi:hypothetical protein
MHKPRPRPATPRGWSGGSTAIYFFAGGGRFGASADIGANRSERKKPKMTNAAPRIFLQEGRKPDLRCALHKGLLCGQRVNSLQMRQRLLWKLGALSQLTPVFVLPGKGT